ncbi:DUF7536 family protein [Halocatena halophila]|uniref:DUF7536 family protein n=1 Tax=Halocatena halophila TaxID=2814576 RepID=UPI002ED0B997
MSSRSTESARSPAVAFLDAIGVFQNAAIGAIVGVAFALCWWAIRVFELLGPAPEVGSPLLYASLAFVLAFGTFVLVTTALTVVTAALAVKRME